MFEHKLLLGLDPHTQELLKAIPNQGLGDKESHFVIASLGQDPAFFGVFLNWLIALEEERKKAPPINVSGIIRVNMPLSSGTYHWMRQALDQWGKPQKPGEADRPEDRPMINLPPFGQVQAYASHGAILAYGYSGSTPFVVERYLNPGQLRAFEAEQAHQVGRLPKGLAIPNCVAFLLEPGMAIKKAQRPLSITGPGVNGNVLTLPSRTETLQIAGRT